MDTLSLTEVCKRLYQKNMLAACDGNISERTPEGRIVVSPSGRPKAFLEDNEYAVVDLDGLVIKGAPSSELAMHLAVYRHCDTAKCVIHAHPPYAIAYSLASDEKWFPVSLLPELILALGQVPITDYALPGTQDMADKIAGMISNHKVLILRRHGVLAWGESIEEAWFGVERIEHAAQIILAASNHGVLKTLPEETLAKLERMRKEIGFRTL